MITGAIHRDDKFSTTTRAFLVVVLKKLSDKFT